MKRLLLLSMVLMLVIAGCAGDEDDGDIDASSEDDVATEPADETEGESDTEPTAEPTVEPEPTEEPEPTNTPEPTATPEVEEADPTATAEPEATEEQGEADSGDEADAASGGEIDVQTGSVGHFVTSYDALSVFGEIVNNGSDHAFIREILITLRADDGSVIESSSAFTYGEVIAPGESAPFAHSFSETDDSFADLEIEFDARPAEEADMFGLDLYFDFETLQADWRAGDFSNAVVGEIQNVGDQAAEFVEVLVSGYDAEGNITFVTSTFSERDLIEAGETSPFTADFLDQAIEEPAEIRVFTQAWAVVE